MAQLPQKKPISINDRLKLALLGALMNRERERGVALPIALALGLILTVGAVIGAIRAYEEQTSTASSASAFKALNAAESSLAKYQELLDKNRLIATYNAFGGTATWQQAGNIPHINELACRQGGGFAQGYGSAAVIAAANNASFQNISSTDPRLGQYRLVSYSYSSTANVGTLTVEGRVNQDASYPATARLVATLPVQPGLPQLNNPPILKPSLNWFNPAVWIGSSSVTDIGSLNVDGNIVISVSNCVVPTGTGQATSSNLKNPNTQLVMADPRSLPSNIPLGNGNNDIDSDGNACDRDDSDDTINCINSTFNEDANANGIFDYEDTNLNGVLDGGEDANSNGLLDTEDTNGNHCFDNGQLPRVCQTEDKDGDGHLDGNEDTNSNGVLDVGEDTDSDGRLDVNEDGNANGIFDNWTELKDANNYYHYLVRDDLNLANKTLKINVGTKVILYVQGNIILNENTKINPGEDLNGNNILDPGEDTPATGNGILDPGEDTVIVNGKLDPGEDKPSPYHNGVLDVNNSAYLEIYGNTGVSGSEQYGCAGGVTCPTNYASFMGTGNIIVRGFIHAPAGTVTVTGTPTVKLTGAIWANNWNGNSASFSIISDDQYYNYSSRPTVVAPIIYPPLQREIQEAE